MSGPAFVLHGVANRDEEAFVAQVGALEARVAARRGEPLELVPVFWGDLGARTEHLDLVIPGTGHTPPGLAEELLRKPSRPGGAATREALLDGPGLVAAAASTTAPARPAVPAAPTSSAGPADAGRPDDTGDRGVGMRPAPGAARLDAAVRTAWPRLQHLPLVDDRVLLSDVGRLLGQTAPGPSDAGERGLGDWVQERLRDLDLLVGRVVANAAGTVNTVVRAQVAPAVAQLLGDVVVYQRLADRIRGRVRDVVAAWSDQHRDVSLPSLGSPAAPLSVVGHSLGGVIAVDLAVADPRPLWISHLVTFGSQWPLFQLVDPRLPGPPPGTPPIPLPAALGSWTNLWEPLDPLAFVAGRAFRLAAGVPTDVEAAHLASTGLWTHSSYWVSDDLTDVLARTL